MIGCGLSHLLLIDYFLRNDNNYYCLILEDDTEPLYDDIYDKIIEIVYKLRNDEWDIVELHYGGSCNYGDDNDNIRPYELNNKLSYHIDIQMHRK